MSREEPFERNWLEIRILNRLNDRRHPIAIHELQSLVPDLKEVIICTLFDMQREGLVTIFDVRLGKMVDITAVGRATLFEAMTAHRRRCD